MLTTFSHNALKTFDSCPRRYKFIHVEKIEIPKRVPANVYLGNAVHHTLARLYEMVLEGKIPTIEYLLDFYAKEWEKPERKQIHIDRDYMTMEDYIAGGRTMLERYYQHYHPFDQSKTIGIERRLDGYVTNTPYKLAGYIDRLSRLPDDTVEICDYKTGKDLPRGGHDPLFYRQMGIYQLLVQENFPDFKSIALVQHYLKLEEILSYVMPEEEIDQLREEIRVTIAQIKRAEQHDDFPPREGGHCDFCEFVKLCPAKRHRLILADEAGEVTGAEKSTAAQAKELVEKYLEVYVQLKQLEAEQNALKEDITQAARDLNMLRLSSNSGMVTVSIKMQEKFPTRSNDPDQYAELSQLVRELELDTCLKIDDHALRDLIVKQQLPEEMLARLMEFVRIEEQVTVRANPKKIELNDPSS